MKSHTLAFLTLFAVAAVAVALWGTNNDPHRDAVTPSEVLMMVCIEGEECTIQIGDRSLEDLEDLTGQEIYAFAQKFDHDWRENSQSQVEPFLLANLYLVAGQDFAPAYVSYNALISEMLQRHPNDVEVYGALHILTIQEWVASRSPQIIEGMQKLYVHGKERLEAEGFDTSRRYQAGDQPLLRTLACGEHVPCVLALATLADQLQTSDRGLWAMHSGDALMSCHTCGDDPVTLEETIYDPSSAWFFYHLAGLSDATKASEEMANITLTASLMIEPFKELSVCQRVYVTDLQATHSVHELVDLSIAWQREAGINALQGGELLRRAADLAEQNSRPDVAVIIREHLQPVEPEYKNPSWVLPEAGTPITFDL